MGNLPKDLVPFDILMTIKESNKLEKLIDFLSSSCFYSYLGCKYSLFLGSIALPI